ncbi:MAG: hypothetical protein Kow00108_26550 [Calditrichia bacterium]
MMKQWLWILLLAGVIYVACDNPSKSTDLPPGKVRMVPKTADTLLAEERGIDALPGLLNVLQIQWYRLPEDDIKRYELYVSEEVQRNYALEFELDVDKVNNNQDFTYNSIDSIYTFLYNISTNSHQLEQPLYFFIRARDELDQQSENSDTVTYTLTSPIEGVGFQFFGEDTVLTWIWNGQAPNDIILRIEREILPSQWTPLLAKKLSADNAIFNRGDYFADPKLYLEDIKNEFGIISGTGKYRFRIDKYYGMDRGSESRWVDIFIN